MLVTFDHDKHEYRDEAGAIIPSVTQIIKSAGLIDDRWANAEAMERGLIVHSACALYDDGELDESTVDDCAFPYLQAWKSFVAEVSPQTIFIEQRVSHGTYRYAGTLDRTCKIGSKRYLIDIKTGHMPAWASLQTAAYANCLEHYHYRAGVELRADGTYRFTEFRDTEDFQVFLSALNIYTWRINHGY